MIGITPVLQPKNTTWTILIVDRLDDSLIDFSKLFLSKSFAGHAPAPGQAKSKHQPQWDRSHTDHRLIIKTRATAPRNVICPAVKHSKKSYPCRRFSDMSPL
jgi:hypothetical protein